jgi:peptide/nickel transport system ATP-binding protein
MMVTEVGTNKLLEIKHLSVDYESAKGAVHAVDDVSFTIERGQIFGLAGESGSGKSTLAYTIARLLQSSAVVTQGQVLYYPPKLPYRPTEPKASCDNSVVSRNTEVREVDKTSKDDAAVDILALNPAQLRAFRWSELSIVFQSAMNALNPVLDIGVQITDVLRAHNPLMNAQEARLRALELLRLVGIAPDRLHSYPHELSGGMRQRAIIAIALALNPEIIIMDEPTTALDVVVQRDILAQIMRLRNDFGFSVIFITHDLSLLLEITDTIAIMYAGRIVEMASREDLYRHPRHPYTYGLLNSFPSLRGPSRRLTGIPGSPPDLRSVPPGCAFHSRCAFAFAACHTIEPALLHVTREGAKVHRGMPPVDTSSARGEVTHVACHLYDAELNPEGPPERLESEYANQH